MSESNTKTMYFLIKEEGLLGKLVSSKNTCFSGLWI